MNIELSDREKIFLNVYLDSFDPLQAVTAAYPDIKKDREISRKFEQLKGRYLVRREIEKALDGITGEGELNPTLIKRKIWERCVDDTDKAPQVKALGLASEILGLKKEVVFVHLNQKTDEELAKIIDERLSLHDANPNVARR